MMKRNYFTMMIRMQYVCIYIMKIKEYETVRRGNDANLGDIFERWGPTLLSICPFEPL